MKPPELDRSKVKYSDVLAGTDFVYTNFGYDLKESIVVKEKQDKKYCKICSELFKRELVLCAYSCH